MRQGTCNVAYTRLLPARAAAKKKRAQLVIVLIPMQRANFGNLAQFHRIGTGIELVELQAHGGDDTQIVTLVLHPHCAHYAVTTRSFALNVERLLCVAVVDDSDLV